MSGPASGYTSQNVLVTWTDSNNGNATATGPWVDDVYLATDAQGDNPTLLAYLTFTGSLAPGESVQLTQQVALPHTLGRTGSWSPPMLTVLYRKVRSSNDDTTVAAAPINVRRLRCPTSL